MSSSAPENSFHGRWRTLDDWGTLPNGDGAALKGIERGPDFFCLLDARVAIAELDIHFLKTRNLSRIGPGAGGKHDVVVAVSRPALRIHDASVQIHVRNFFLHELNVIPIS